MTSHRDSGRQDGSPPWQATRDARSWPAEAYAYAAPVAGSVGPEVIVRPGDPGARQQPDGYSVAAETWAPEPPPQIEFDVRYVSSFSELLEPITPPTEARMRESLRQIRDHLDASLPDAARRYMAAAEPPPTPDLSRLCVLALARMMREQPTLAGAESLLRRWLYENGCEEALQAGHRYLSEPPKAELPQRALDLEAADGEA